MISRRTSIAVGALMVLFSVSGWGASLILNGGFEDGCIGGPPANDSLTGCVTINNWQIQPGTPVGGGNTYTQLVSNNTTGNPANDFPPNSFAPFLVLDGSYAMRFGDPAETNGGYVYQDVVLGAGTYNLSYDYIGFGAEDNPGWFLPFFQPVGDLLPDPPQNSIALGTPDWIHVVTAVNVPVGGTYRLGFFAANSAADWGLDNVSLDAVPEPSTFALLSLPLLALSLLRRRR